MDRRDFVKLCSAAGLAVAGAGLLSKTNQAEAADGPTSELWLLFNAGGGWDPLHLCDPKGKADNPDFNLTNYDAGQIGQAGNIRYAPVPGHKEFFEAYQDRLIVINGLNTSTNGHDTGSRVVWSGSLIEGRPSFGALVGSAHAALPMSYITNGGYDTTAGVVPVTRVGSIDALQKLAYTNRTSADEVDSSLYHTDDTVSRIRAARDARLSERLAAQRLPRFSDSMSTLMVSRGGTNELKRLSEFMPAELEGNRLKRQAQVAIAAYRAGLTASANISRGGFDTHSNHDEDHLPRLQDLLSGIDFAVKEAERQGVADRVNIVVGSDFGRTPKYNSGGGKDHWAITSMMFMLAGVAGNRVIGSTDVGFKAVGVNAGTLASEPGGVIIKPSHVHKALQKKAGLDLDTDALRRFNLDAEDLPLFG